MKFQLDKDGEAVNISMKGKCTFSDYDYFQEILAIVDEGGVNQMDIDISGLEFIDSSGLGMLLMIKDKTKLDIVLVSPQGQVQKMIGVASLDKIFKVI